MLLALAIGYGVMGLVTGSFIFAYFHSAGGIPDLPMTLLFALVAAVFWPLLWLAWGAQFLFHR